MVLPFHHHLVLVVHCRGRRPDKLLGIDDKLLVAVTTTIPLGFSCWTKYRNDIITDDKITLIY